MDITHLALTLGVLLGVVIVGLLAIVPLALDLPGHS